MKTWEKILVEASAAWEKETKEEGARVGCALFCIRTGRQAELDAGKLFLPASNNKLWTSIAALECLGKNYCWTTRFTVHDRALCIHGGGDPGFGWEEALIVARHLKKKGMTQLPPVLFLDNSWLTGRPWGTGWAWDDLAQGYGARVESLIMEGNRIIFRAAPEGEASRLSWYPELPSVQVIPHLSWTKARYSDVTVEREGNTHRFRLQGRLSRREPEVSGAVWCGARFFAEVFVETCRHAGILIPDRWEVREGVPESGTRITVEYASRPLSKVLHRVNRDSDNLTAEILLRTLGLEGKGVDHETAGLEVVRETLGKWKLTGPAVYTDGSGLSGYNLSSPRALAELLRTFLRREDFPIFLDSLSLYGVHGTLADRVEEFPAGTTVAAKTGSLAGVKTLTGYLLRSGLPRYGFSLMVNGLLEEENGERLQDMFLARLASFR
ncbi:D-alanyl-D-alanine carboxypeptidase/D-alanyl-D-alanine endopeptidase [Salinithrix halophila]|uniref:D-alanyl-D-alanine carboxypeptidase/D-alanyl-D-alanine-endopeptidase n=1 Tax=Salinithrix halophila TaxID=1485204 RepID=A0ABV8JE23_9BACL